MLDDSKESDPTAMEPGERVFDDDGHPVGLVVGLTDDGFQVEASDSTNPHDGDQEEMPGQGAGEGYLMWRCAECGAMGELDDGMPSTCPNCGAAGKDVSEVVED